MSRTILYILLLLALCIFPIFLHLDVQPISAFDEARPANNAIEMLENGNYLVMQYRGEPDTWYTKPPLMIWLQVVCLKFIGYNELAVRLPTGIAALMTCFLVFGFCYKKMNSAVLGFFSVLVLLTTNGYIGEHVSRTADPDTLLTFFVTLYCMAYYLFLETGKSKYLYGFAVALALGGLTKGVAAFLFLPGLLLYTLAVKKFFFVLTMRHFYGAISVVLVSVLGFYFARESLNPGYIDAVIFHEWGRRMSEPIEGHTGGYWVYLETIYKKQFWPWVIALPVVLLLIRKGTKDMQRFLLMVLLSTSFYLLIISLAETKVFWYTALIFPLWAIGVGYGLQRVCRQIGSRLPLRSNNAKYLFAGVFALVVFAIPYKGIIEKVTHEKTTFPLNFHSLFLKKMKIEQKKLVMIDGKYNASQVFGMRCYNKKGYDITLDSVHHLQVGQVALFCTRAEKDSMRVHYKYEVIERFKTCMTAKIVERRIVN